MVAVLAAFELCGAVCVSSAHVAPGIGLLFSSASFFAFLFFLDAALGIASDVCYAGSTPEDEGRSEKVKNI